MAVHGRVEVWGVVLVFVLDDLPDTVPPDGGRMLPKRGENGAQTWTARRMPVTTSAGMPGPLSRNRPDVFWLARIPCVFIGTNISNGLKGCSRTIPDSLQIFLGDREPRRVRTCHADLCGIRDPEFQGREELGRAPRSIRRGQHTPIAGPIRSIRPAPQVGSPEPNGNHREPRPLPPPTSKFTAQTRFGLHRRVASDASSTPKTPEP